MRKRKSAMQEAAEEAMLRQEEVDIEHLITQLETVNGDLASPPIVLLKNTDSLFEMAIESCKIGRIEALLEQFCAAKDTLNQVRDLLGSRRYIEEFWSELGELEWFNGLLDSYRENRVHDVASTIRKGCR